MAEQHTPMLSLRGLTRRFGGLTAVDAIDLDLARGELISIIGPNGAGKTTLFNLVTGLDLPDAGTVSFEGQDITGLSPVMPRYHTREAALQALDSRSN